MDDMINRHDSIAEENIEPNGRPAKDQFEEDVYKRQADRLFYLLPLYLRGGICLVTDSFKP